jgi:myo-inositol-1(or 4)-monophosphatase
MGTRELEVAFEAAAEAGRHSLGSFHGDRSISFKAGREIVTNVDRDCEEIIKGILLDAFPAHGFWGEESGREPDNSDYTWIVDPIDGTTNYARGIKLYGISIALAREKQVILGVVHNPILGEFFYAERGGGAYLKDGSAAPGSIQVSATHELGGSLIYLSRNLAAKLRRITAAGAKARILASTAYEICQVAAGRTDGCYKSARNCWGFSAACLLVEEAGGRVTDFSGMGWSLDSRQLVISNGVLHGSLLEILTGDPPWVTTPA